jgi:2-keto-4-pentenoate hydratase
MAATADGIEAAALRLRQAGTLRRQCFPIGDLLDDPTEADAYAVQDMVVELSRVSGAEVIGYKLLNPLHEHDVRPVQGVLLDTMHVASGGSVELRRLLDPVIELKLGFTFGDDLGTYRDLDAVRRGIVGIAAVIEVADSRIGAATTHLDVVADNALAGALAVGAPVTASALDVDAVTLVLRRGGTSVVDASVDADLAAALRDVLWLASAAERRGRTVRAGELVVTPAIGPSVPVRGSDLYAASSNVLEPVSLTVADAVSPQPLPQEIRS